MAVSTKSARLKGKYYKLIDTINHNDYEADEFSVGNFSLVNAKTIHAPMIQEAFVNIEYTLKEIQDLTGKPNQSAIATINIEKYD